jgi:uncharacterized membrane protein
MSTFVFMKKFISYFFNGLLLIVPVGITILIFFRIIAWIEGLIAKTGGLVNPFVDFMIVIVAALGLIIFIGALGSSYIFRPVFNLFDHALERMPVVKTLYSTTKDIMNAFVGSKKKFDRPVRVACDGERSNFQLGFLTQDDLSSLNIGQGLVAVYIPFSYSFAGKVILVPRDRVIPIDAPPGEVMKFILSGGITEPDNENLHKK